jgi:hypothetical protein
VSTALRPDADRAAILEHLAQWPADELVADAMMAPALGSWEPVICRVDGRVSQSVWIGPAVTEDESLDVRRRIAEARARGLLMELKQREKDNAKL